MGGISAPEYAGRAITSPKYINSYNAGQPCIECWQVGRNFGGIGTSTGVYRSLNADDLWGIRWPTESVEELKPMRQLRMKALLIGCALLWCVGATAHAQLTIPQGGDQSSTPNPLVDTTIKPGKMFLFDLEARFAKDVAAKGGAGFASWFADDGVALGNGKPPVVGKVAIEKSATWTPQQYQLTWTPTDAVMSPQGDMGYTWGHYEGRSKDANGNPVLTGGRYMTIWRKQPDGSWKVVLDAGADDAPAAGDCCKLPPGEQ